MVNLTHGFFSVQVSCYFGVVRILQSTFWYSFFLNLHKKIKVSMMLNENETNGIHVLHIELHYIASPS